MNYRLTLAVESMQDQRRYNRPSAQEVAALIPTETERTGGERDIVVSTREGPLQRISVTSPMYLPLGYPLLLPHGDAGWHPGISRATEARGPVGEDENEEPQATPPVRQGRCRHSAIRLSFRNGVFHTPIFCSSRPE